MDSYVSDRGSLGLADGSAPVIVMMSIPTYGHTLPMLKICSYLTQEGFLVFFIGGREHEEQIRRAGAEFVAHPTWMTPNFKEARDNIADGLERGVYEVKQVYIGTMPSRYRVMKQTLERVRELHRSRKVIILHECISAFSTIPFHYGATLPRGYTEFPKVINIPIYALFVTSVDTAAMFGPGLPPLTGWFEKARNRVFLEVARRTAIVTGMMDEMNKTMAELGATKQLNNQQFINDVITTDADITLMVCSPSMEYPRSDLNPKIRFIGCLPNSIRATTFRPSFHPPAWWSDIERNARLPTKDRKKLVMVTQGTLSLDYLDLIIPTIQGLADKSDVLVVAVLGVRDARLPHDVELTTNGISVVPENTRIADYLPYESILPMADVSVQNGGYGGWSQATMYGVPTVLAGTSEEKAETVMRAQWAGTSVGIKKSRPTAEELRTAVDTVLSNHEYKTRALELKEENEKLDAFKQITQWIGELSR